MHLCPSCSAHSWPSNTRGLRACPQCAATIALTVDGPKVYRDTLDRRTRAENSRHTSKLSDPLTRLKRSLYHVPDDDMTVLCAMCAARTPLFGFTPDSKPAILGTIEIDEPIRVQVQTGLDWNGEKFMPVYETRIMRPSKVRGHICHDCAIVYPVRPVSNEHELEARKRSNFLGERVRPATYNTQVQRIEADIATLTIERTKLQLLKAGIEPWAVHNAAIDACASHVGPCWARTFDGRWLGQSAIYIGHRRASKAPKTPTVWRPDGFHTATGVYDPIEHIDRARYHGPASVTHWTGRLKLTSEKLDSTEFSWQRLAPFSGFRPIRPYVGIGHSVKASHTTLQPTSLSLWHHWLKHCRSYVPVPSLPVRFCSRPLPRRAIPLRPV